MGCSGSAHADKRLEALRRATEDQQLVTVRRRIKRADRLKGYVIAVGRRWTLMTTLGGGISLDGFTAFRVNDLARVRPDSQSDRFVKQALTQHGEWPPRPPYEEVALGRTSDLIRSSADSFPLVTLHLERIDPNVCYIGVPVGWGRRSVRLLGVSPQATWERSPDRWRFADITRVDFGGPYESALNEVAGTPPTSH